MFGCMYVSLDITAASDAIANAQMFNADLNNTTLYVTKPLDPQCAKKIVQAGIRCVKYAAVSHPVMESQHQSEEKVQKKTDENDASTEKETEKKGMM